MVNGPPKDGSDLSPEELAWIAGFLEGEGSFTIPKIWQDKQHSYVKITAAQKQREPLERLQRMLGGAINKELRNGEFIIWRWSHCCTKTESVMKLLEPLMSPRRQGQIQKSLVLAIPSTVDHSEKIRKTWITRKEKYGPVGSSHPKNRNKKGRFV